MQPAESLLAINDLPIDALKFLKTQKYELITKI